MLLSSVPQLQTKWNGERPREAAIESAGPPTREAPPLEEVEPGHLVARGD